MNSPSGRPSLTIRRATLDDLPAIMRIEVISFPTPWPREMFECDLVPSADRLYLVAEIDGELVGYTGMWLFASEAHIGTLAVDAPYRRRGIGEILMLTLLSQAARFGARYAVLEYRISNEPAARLYRKLGFQLVRIRPGYYTDTREDAVEVSISDLNSAARIQALADLAKHWQRTHDYVLRIDI